MNWSRVTAMKVVVMILLASNGLFSMDPIERAKSPVSQWDKVEKVDLDAEINPAVQKSLDDIFKKPTTDEANDLLLSRLNKFTDLLSNMSRKVLPPEKRFVVASLLDSKKTYLRDYDAESERSLKYPLHKAVREGNIKDVWNFLTKGINLLSYNHVGMQPLHYVFYLSNEESAIQIVTALYNSFEAHKQTSIDFLNVMIRGNASEIIEMRESGAHEILRFFISNFQPFPRIDDMADYYELMPKIEGDHDPLEREKEKARNLLHQLQSMNLMAIPTRSCIMPLTLAIEAKKFVLANKLIELGAPVNVDPESTQQPLLLAIQSGNQDFVNILLALGADPLNSDILEYLNTIDDSSSEARQYVRTIKSKLRKAMMNQIQAME